MTITRQGSTQGIPHAPIISSVVGYQGTAYLLGVTAEGADVAIQTDLVLQRIDALLATAGTDKSRLLTAQVWLANMDDFDAHNVVWNTWVDVDNPPVRACVEARLWHPGSLVEIMVTAALPDPQ